MDHQVEALQIEFYSTLAETGRVKSTAAQDPLASDSSEKGYYSPHAGRIPDAAP